MAQRLYRVTILHFFSAECRELSYSLSRSSRSMKTAQRRMPNKSFNADIRYSEITEISLRQEEMEREKQFISVFFSPFPCIRARCGGLPAIGPRRKKTCLRSFENNKGADQPAHLRSLISDFVIPL